MVRRVPFKNIIQERGRRSFTAFYRGQSEVKFLNKSIMHCWGLRLCRSCPWSAGVKIRRAIEPMARKIACGPSKLILGAPEVPADFEATIIPL